LYVKEERTKGKTQLRRKREEGRNPDGSMLLRRRWRRWGRKERWVDMERESNNRPRRSLGGCL
jgi:hypothetical protein